MQTCPGHRKERAPLDHSHLPSLDGYWPHILPCTAHELQCVPLGAAPHPTAPWQPEYASVCLDAPGSSGPVLQAKPCAAPTAKGARCQVGCLISPTEHTDLPTQASDCTSLPRKLGEGAHSAAATENKTLQGQPLSTQVGAFPLPPSNLIEAKP